MMAIDRASEVVHTAIAVFCRQGYAGTSVQDIANALGMPKATLYHYISSKEDLLAQIFTLASDDVEVLTTEVTKLDLPAVDRLRLFISGYVYLTTVELERTIIYSREWRYLAGALRDSVIARRVMLDEFLIGLIDAAKASGDVQAELDTKRAAYFIWGAVSSLPDWYRRSGPDTPHQIAWTYSVLALRVVLSDPAAIPARVDEQAELATLNALIRR
jgi:TetR/AcrR family transcriptional regulator, cholesterol catabolism regulator